MKIEIGKAFPQYFKPLYPEEFELFSHFETTAGIPTVLFAITTWKENGKPNVCFHAWSCFHGDKTAFLLSWETFISIPIPMQISKEKSAFVSIFCR